MQFELLDHCNFTLEVVSFVSNVGVLVVLAALGNNDAESPEVSKRHTMSHPPPHIPGLEGSNGKAGYYDSVPADTPPNSTPDRKDRVSFCS